MNLQPPSPPQHPSSPPSTLSSTATSVQAQGEPVALVHTPATHTPASSTARLTRIALSLGIVALIIFIGQQAWTLSQTLSSILSTLAASWFIALLIRPLIYYLCAIPLVPSLIVRAVRRRYGDSIARRVAATRMPFGVSVTIIYVILLVLIIGGITIAITAIIPQAETLIRALPGFTSSLPQQIALLWVDVAQRLNFDPSVLNTYLLTQDIAGRITGLVQLALSQAVNLATFTAVAVGQMLLVLILSLYIVIEDKLIERQFFAVLPRRWHEAMRAMFMAVNRSFNGYMRGQVVAALIRMAFTMITFQFAGLNFGIVIGLVYGLLSFIPLIGSPIGISIAAIVSLIVSPMVFWPVLITLLILDFVIAYLVLPQLLADAVGVPSLIGLVSISLGVQLFGFWGLVFSIPIVGAAYAIIFDFWLPRKRRAEGLPELDPAFAELVYPRRKPRQPAPHVPGFAERYAVRVWQRTQPVLLVFGRRVVELVRQGIHAARALVKARVGR